MTRLPELQRPRAGVEGRARRLLRWYRGDPAVEVDSRLMAQTLGAVYLAGSTLALVWTLLPSASAGSRSAVAICALAGEAVGGLLLSGLLYAQPRVVFELSVAVATLLISIAVYFAGMAGTGLAFLYMWCTPYAYWFFPRDRAVLQAALAVAGFAAAAVGASLHDPRLAGPLHTDWGRILMLTGALLMVGELVRRLGESAAHSHQRFAQVFARSATPMARLTLDGRYLDVNDAFCDAVGRRRSEVIGSSMQALTPPDQAARLEEVGRAVASGRVPGSLLERDYLRPDGSRVSFLASVSLLGEQGAPDAEVFVQALDLSERKATERALAESEQRYRTLIEASQAVVWASDNEGRITFVNDAMPRVLGYSTEEVLGRSMSEFLPERERPAARTRLGQLRAGQAVSGEAPHLRRDGSELIGSYSVAPTVDAQGRPTGFVGTVIDVTERYRAQQALRVSEAQLRALIDNAPAVITVRAPGGRLLDINREGARVLGRSREDLLGKPHDDMHDAAQAQEFARLDERVLASGEPVVHDVTVPLPDGEHCYLAVAFPLPGDAGQTSTVCRISFDVTDREHARQELIKSHEQRRRLLAELVRAQEDERRRIAADVHDESIQVLAGVAIRLGMLSGMLDRPEQQRLITGLDDSVRRGIRSLRQLLFDLRLPALDELGLAAALRSYLSETLAREGATYTLEDRLVTEPSAELRTVLYRVAQEALSNVRKHAQAGHV